MPQTVKTVENLEKEAIIELKYSLHEIGLTSASSEHVTFIKRAVRECVACMSESAEPIDINRSRAKNFPGPTRMPMSMCFTTMDIRNMSFIRKRTH